MNKEFIQYAIDANALTSTSAAGTALNPKIWDYMVRDFAEENLVMTQLSEVVDFRKPGVDLTVTFDIAPTAADELAETAAITITADSVRQVTFTPTEYGKGFAVTQKEMNRSFADTMSRFSKKLGYALAKKKDALAISTARTAKTATIMPNAKTVATTLAETDTLGYEVIIKGARAIEGHLYQPFALVMNHYQKADLLSLDKVNKANEFGTRDAVAKGLVGELFGIQLFVSTQIINEASGATNTAQALLLGKHPNGESPLAIGIKQDPRVATDYDIKLRYHEIVAHEEYQWQAIHPGGIVSLQTYSA